MARFLFVVQGEGRGHMTQALALRSLLLKAGHSVVAVLVGRVEGRTLPAFFTEALSEPLHQFDSPNFVKDKENKGIAWGATFSHNLWQAGRFLHSARQIRQWVKHYRPDLIVNFYDLLAGIAHGRRSLGVPMVCIGHQYLLEHPDFRHPHWGLDRLGLTLNTRMTARGASLQLALSFDDAYADTRKIKVVAPLLRSELYELQVSGGDFILAYVNNAGYGKEIIEWQRAHPHIKVHCFWDRKGEPKTYTPQPNLTLHQLDGALFLKMMASCRALATTAGFESVCEAMVLGKPVLMVPIRGQYEQQCNAHDALRAGAGIWANSFDLGRLLDYLPRHQARIEETRAWHARGRQKLLHLLEQVAGQPSMVANGPVSGANGSAAHG
ncbi:MAG: glycosyl transferase [Thermonema sp.]|uniref:glycosyltransferase family protein n=1 Tax=Thermonema sp. TaxID=2231181 RepID=UPI0021DDF0D3|nr:glycosyltransferase family protein [Thermonema sp.]GIV38383.1 MAG: glycosyl transferase [Thermonema sp.]